MKKISKWSILLLTVTLISLIFAATTNACRMWGMVSDMSPGEAQIIEQHLTAFRTFAALMTMVGASVTFIAETELPFIR